MTNPSEDDVIEQQSFRNAMARLCSAVNIVTTAGSAGQAGFTASAVCSVTDCPPTLLVCLNRNASAYPNVIGNGVLCVNTLGDGHESLSTWFGGKTPQDMRFATAAWSTLKTGSPALDDAVVSFDCEITEVVSVSTHDILICRVRQIRQNGGVGGLAYFDRRYHALAASAS